MIRVEIQGALEAGERMRFLAFTEAERKKVHAFLGKDLQQALRKAVREVVLGSPLELFEGSAAVRKEKARLFAGAVRFAARPGDVRLYDADTVGRGLRRSKPGDKATLEQAARLVMLGYLHGKKLRLKERQIMRLLSRKQAGVAIRVLQEKQPGAQQAQARQLSKRKTRGGSLILMVWRLRGDGILRRVDPLAVWRRFLKAKLERRA